MPAQQQILPADEVLKLYASHLKSQSWCLDSSAPLTMAFHAKSGRTANLDYFRNTFSAWSKASGIRVLQADYRNFLDGLRFKLPVRLPSILGSTFRPSPEPFVDFHGATFANTFVSFDPPKPADGSAPLADELLCRLFPDAQERKTVLQWLAHIIQFPMERPQWGLLITGQGGTCKTSLLKLVRLALGGRHVWSKNDYTEVLSQRFNQIVPDNLLVGFDDAVASRDTYERLKDTMTREFQQVEIKGQQGLVNREVYARLAVLSNSVRPMRIANDRRFFAPAFCEHLRSPEESAEFGAKLHEWLDEKGTQAILHHWFKSVDLSDFRSGRCERTETLIRMEGASTPALERHIAEFLEDRTEGDQPPIFHEQELADHLSAAGLSNCHPDEIARKLTEQGYEHKRSRNPFDAAKKIWLWKPAGVRRSRELSVAEKSRLQRYADPTF